jgi:hypothetical protein
LAHVHASQLLPKRPAAQLSHEAPEKPVAHVHAPVPLRPVSQLPCAPQAHAEQLAP